MQEWFTALELEQLALPDLPAERQNIRRKAKRENWQTEVRDLPGGGKPTAHYHVSSLPEEARRALLERRLQQDERTHKVVGVLQAGAEAAARDQARRDLCGLALLGTLTEKERRLVDARRDILDAFRRFLAEADVSLGKGRSVFCRLYREESLDLPAETYDAVSPFATRTLQRWMLAFEKDGTAGLVPGYGKRAGRSYTSHWDEYPEQRRLAEAFIYQRGKHVNAVHLRLELKAQFPGQKMPHRSTISRFLQRWTHDNPQVADRVTEPDKWKGKHLVAIGKKDEEVSRLNQLWEIDTTPADVLLQYEHPDGRTSTKRYAVIGLIEVYSRMAMLHVVPYESTYGVLSLLRKAVLEWCRFPECVRTDQGSAYTSQYFVRAMLDLDIGTDLLPPGTPEGKPFIERFLGTFNGGLITLLPAYIGRNVGERKAIEMRSKAFERGGLLTKGESMEVPLTRETFQDFCDTWLDRYNKVDKHSTLDRTPFQRVAQWIQQGESVRGFSEEMRGDYERALQMLMAPAPKASGRAEGIRTVRKGKISVDRIEYTAPELAGEWNSRHVFARYDETDISRIFVYTPEGEFICIAGGLGVPGGISRKEAARKARATQQAFMREAIAELKQQAREFDHLGKAAVNLVKESQEQTDKVQSLSLPVEPHMTPAMEEGLRAAKAHHDAVTPRPLRKEYTPEEREGIRRMDEERARTQAARPLFMRELDRFEWIMARAQAGHAVEPGDRLFWDKFVSERNYPLGEYNLEEVMRGATSGKAANQ